MHCLDLITHRQERGLHELVPEHCIGFDGDDTRIDDEENERHDAVAASLFEKAYLSHDGEEILERAMANVNDPWGVFLSNQPIEQCHLAADVSNVDDSCELRQIVRQLRSFVSQVECRYRSIFDHVVLGKQPGN